MYVNLSPGGIPKRAVESAHLSVAGFDGDACAHPRIHGGPEKAVLLVTSEAIAELRAAGYDLFPGALGENLTTEGLDRREMRLGDRFRAGLAIIELASMRTPCKTLDVYNRPGREPIQQLIYDERVKAGNARTPCWGLAGFYARVVRPGVVVAGAGISRLDSVA